MCIQHLNHQRNSPICFLSTTVFMVLWHACREPHACSAALPEQGRTSSAFECAAEHGAPPSALFKGTLRYQTYVRINTEGGKTHTQQFSANQAKPSLAFTSLINLSLNLTTLEAAFFWRFVDVLDMSDISGTATGRSLKNVKVCI